MKRTLLHVVDMRTADFVTAKLSWLFASYRYQYIKTPVENTLLFDLAVTTCDEKPIDSRQIEMLFYFAGHYEAEAKNKLYGY